MSYAGWHREYTHGLSPRAASDFNNRLLASGTGSAGSRSPTSRTGYPRDYRPPVGRTRSVFDLQNQRSMAKRAGVLDLFNAYVAGGRGALSVAEQAKLGAANISDVRL
jgi:hypothetical protein